MRALFAVLLVLSALWSGYWFVGSTAKKTVIDTWLADRRADGWEANYKDFRVVGFPNRFDSRFTELTLFDPRTGTGWQAPLFNILALSYKPNHIIAAFAHSQKVILPGEDLSVGSSEMLASVTFEPDTLLAISQTLLRGSDLSVKSTLGWRMQADNLAFSTRARANGQFAHDVVFDVENLRPTKAFREVLDPAGKLPAAMTRLFLDLALDFDAPWDRRAVESGTPEVTHIQLSGLELTWGVLSVQGTGDLDVAQDGQIDGKLDLRFANWRGILKLFEDSGVFPRELAGAIESALSLWTSASDDPSSLAVPLVLKNGEMLLGPVKLGPAPRFIRS